MGPERAGFGQNAHPLVFAAWVGMLAAALNLLPLGQRDAGHIICVTLGRHWTPISIVTVGSAVVMTMVSSSWVALTIMMLVMLLALGPQHPGVIYEFEPLGAGRRVLAMVALLILALCFTPTPIEPYTLMGSAR